jgi:hypothetical protein
MSKIKLISFLISLIQITSNSISIPLDKKPENNFFTVPISIGTPSDIQIFEVQVDTTTSETWVPSINTTYNINPKYDLSLSSSSNTSNKTMEIFDEDGDVSGKATHDVIKIGKYSLDKFGFVSIINYPNNFKDYPNGKLGLGYKQDHGDEFNFIRMLKEKGLVNNEIFTIDPFQKELIIGNYPSKYLNNTYSFCNLTETHDLDDDYRAGWVCELTHAFFFKPLKYLEDGVETTNARVIFDSAYQYIGIPKRNLDLFKKNYFESILNETCIEMRAKRETYFVCENDEKLDNANITFVIGGYGYVLSKKELFKPLYANKLECLIRFIKQNDNIYSFGVPFVNNYVMSYDAENQQVGFFGGKKVDYYNDWQLWMKGISPKQRDYMKKLIIGACALGGVLLLIVACLIIRACRKKNSSEIEHGPLMNNEQGANMQNDLNY